MRNRVGMPWRPEPTRESRQARLFLLLVGGSALAWVLSLVYQLIVSKQAILAAALKAAEGVR